MRFSLVVALFFVAGCGQDPLLLIDLKTDIVPGAEFDRVRVDVIEAAGAGATFREHPVSVGEDYLNGARVAELEGLTAGSVTVRLTLTSDGDEVVQRPVRVELDGRLAVTVVITRNCVGVTCPLDDPTAQACLAGRCVQDTCVEGDPSCGEAECADDSECRGGRTCAVGRCSAGTCLYEPGDRCPSSTMCDLDYGCIVPEWLDVARTLRDSAVLGTDGDPAATTFASGALPGGAGAWVGGVLGPDGHIYGIPFDATQVLDIDPVAKTVSGFGDLPGERKYVGGVLGPDGIIYACPARADQWLAIDPVARTVELFGPIVDPAFDHAYAGGVIGLDGRVYCMPSFATNVSVIDPTDRSVTFIGDLPPDAHKYRGGVLTPSGHIVAIPANGATEVLRIDTTAGTVEGFETVSPTGRDWYGGVITGTGSTLGLPCEGTTLLKIDPNRRSVDFIETPAVSLSPWGRAGAIAPSGAAFVMPNADGPILEIDLSRGASVREISAPPSPDGAWIGAVSAPDGHVYGIPWNADAILEIDTASRGSLPMELLLSPWLNKL